MLDLKSASSDMTLMTPGFCISVGVAILAVLILVILSVYLVRTRDEVVAIFFAPCIFIAFIAVGVGAPYFYRNNYYRAINDDVKQWAQDRYNLEVSDDMAHSIAGPGSLGDRREAHPTIAKTVEGETIGISYVVIDDYVMIVKDGSLEEYPVVEKR